MDKAESSKTSVSQSSSDKESPKLPYHPAFVPVPPKKHGHKLVYLYLLFLLVAAAGGLGSLISHRHTEDTTKPSVSKVAKSAMATSPTLYNNATSSISAGPNFDTYTNKVLGFSFVFPTTAKAVNACVKTNTVPVDGGRKNVHTAEHYYTTQGAVPITVLNDGDNFYVAAASAYELTGVTPATVNGQSGYSFASGCEKVTTTPQLITKYLTQSTAAPTYADIYNLPLTAKIVTPGVQLNDEVQKIFGDPTLRVSKFINDPEGGWDNLSFTCANGNDCADLGGSYTLQYYPTNHLLIFWSTGQACVFLQSTTCYDSQIVSSFHPIY